MRSLFINYYSFPNLLLVMLLTFCSTTWENVIVVREYGPFFLGTLLGMLLGTDNDFCFRLERLAF